MREKFDKYKYNIAAGIAAAITVVGLYMLYTTYVRDERPDVEKPAAEYAGASVTEPTDKIIAAGGEDVSEIPPATEPAPVTTQGADDADSGDTAIGKDDAADVPDGPLIKRRARQPLEKYDDLLARNGDVIGWIAIEDTRIDYEVMYDGTDYYLNHDIDHRELTAGSIYMDPSDDPDRDDYNILLHGHHMKNGTMFKDLVNYKNRPFFDTHRLVRFDTLYDDMLWEVFSVYVLDADHETIIARYENDDDFFAAAEGFKERSMFAVEGLDLSPTDRILTLSTCSYETPNARTIVHARLIWKNGGFISEPTLDTETLSATGVS